METEKIKTITVLPPKISQYFDRLLLTMPIEFNDSLQRIYEIFESIEEEAYKFKDYPEEYERWLRLKSKFMEIYVRTKAKEKIKGKQAQNRTKEPFYYIRMPNKRLERIFFGLRFNNKKKRCDRK